jgi:hypothetical protein
MTEKENMEAFSTIISVFSIFSLELFFKEKQIAATLRNYVIFMHS